MVESGWYLPGECPRPDLGRYRVEEVAPTHVAIRYLPATPSCKVIVFDPPAMPEGWYVGQIVEAHLVEQKEGGLHIVIEPQEGER